MEWEKRAMAHVNQPTDEARALADERAAKLQEAEKALEVMQRAVDSVMPKGMLKVSKYAMTPVERTAVELAVQLRGKEFDECRVALRLDQILEIDQNGKLIRLPIDAVIRATNTLLANYTKGF